VLAAGLSSWLAAPPTAAAAAADNDDDPALCIFVLLGDAILGRGVADEGYSE
jgi:hypothetical protein